MKFSKADISGIITIEPDCHGDNRGFFMETYEKRKYVENGIVTEFIQDNLSFSAKKEL